MSGEIWMFLINVREKRFTPYHVATDSEAAMKEIEYLIGARKPFAIHYGNDLDQFARGFEAWGAREEV